MRVTLRTNSAGPAAQAEVLAAVQAAAADVVGIGAARIDVSSVAELDGHRTAGGAPVVVLTPVNPASAQVRVEVHGADDWRLSVAGGPQFEFDRPHGELLTKLIRLVMAGHYEDRCARETTRPRLAPWRETVEDVRTAIFGAGPALMISRRSPAGSAMPEPRRRFAAYA